MSDLVQRFYLVFGYVGSGNRVLSVRTAVKPSALDHNEIAILVTASLPRAFFQRPLLSASIAVLSDGVEPKTVTVEMASEIADVVKEFTGLDIKFSIAPVETEAT